MEQGKDKQKGEVESNMIKKKSVRELLGESLTELLKSKPFEKITVNEIADNCGVGRRTFYNNFTDKHDLATWLYMRQLNEFVFSVERATLTDFIRYTTEVVSKDLQVIKAIDKYRGQNNLRDSLAGPMADIYVKVIEKYYDVRVSAEMGQEIEFYVGGQIAYVARIIHRPEIPTSEEVTEFFIRCIPESLKQFI